jgi:hypothetical protein
VYTLKRSGWAKPISVTPNCATNSMAKLKGAPTATTAPMPAHHRFLD